MKSWTKKPYANNRYAGVLHILIDQNAQKNQQQRPHAKACCVFMYINNHCFYIQFLGSILGWNFKNGENRLIWLNSSDQLFFGVTQNDCNEWVRVREIERNQNEKKEGKNHYSERMRDAHCLDHSHLHSRSLTPSLSHYYWLFYYYYISVKLVVLHKIH